jgi:hypothetical protein
MSEAGIDFHAHLHRARVNEPAVRRAASKPASPLSRAPKPENKTKKKRGWKAAL